MLVEGRHFLPTVAPERLGHKALAVNLSDLAACGAKPLAYTLALALPKVDEVFLERFARGLHTPRKAHDCELIGGDTTAGPLTICITVYGEVPAQQALLRSGARAGDDVYVSGTLGDARLALEVFRGTLSLDAPAFESVRVAMEQPQPRVSLGLALRGVATSAIDVSDGLHGRPFAHPAVLRSRCNDRRRRVAVQCGARRTGHRAEGANARWPAATITSLPSPRRPHSARRCRRPPVAQALR